jgi:uncharacterized protein DUF6893
MRRGFANNGFTGRVAKVIGAVLMAGAGVLVLTQLDSVRRYINMRRMSAPRRRNPPPGTQRAGTDTPPRWGTSHWPVH